MGFSSTPSLTQLDPCIPDSPTNIALRAGRGRIRIPPLAGGPTVELAYIGRLVWVGRREQGTQLVAVLPGAIASPNLAAMCGIVPARVSILSRSRAPLRQASATSPEGTATWRPCG